MEKFSIGIAAIFITIGFSFVVGHLLMPLPSTVGEKVKVGATIVTVLAASAGFCYCVGSVILFLIK